MYHNKFSPLELLFLVHGTIKADSLGMTKIHTEKE